MALRVFSLRLICPAIALTCATTISTERVKAQAVVPDSTLNTIVTPNNSTFTIDNGTRSGNNLFHSFREFSIPTGGSAHFNNANDVQNIFSRVTGGTASSIDGIIRANGTANLFLLNPNGILFGSNSRLNIGGSFVATTAQSVKFADNTEFSALSSTPPLLTMSAPIGLQLGSNPGSIQVQGNGYRFAPSSATLAPVNSELSVQPGKTLALIGGDIHLKGGVLTTSQGQIVLGSGAAGAVSLQATPIGWTVGYEGISAFQDIRLSNQAALIALGDGGGSIQVQGRQITVQDGSAIGIFNMGTQAPIGNLQIRAADSLNLIGRSADESFGSMFGNASRNRGNSSGIDIATRRLTLQNGANIFTEAPPTDATGVGGHITIQASESIEMSGLSPVLGRSNEILTTTRTAAQSGNITISTRQLIVRDGSPVGSISFTRGNAGDITLNALESVQVSGTDKRSTPSLIGSTAFGTGNAGQVTVNTQRLTVREGGRIDSSTVNRGNAGSITIQASELVEVSGRVQGSRNPSLISSSANILDPVLRQRFRLPDAPSGAAGNVTINTRQLTVTDGANITVKNEGIGNAGRLTVEADQIALNNGNFTAETVKGEGGNLFLRSTSLLLRNQSMIEATSDSFGDGGNIEINVPVILGLENSNIVANASQGRGGKINITTQGIIGLAFRDTLTPEIDPTNDITASSGIGVNGSVQVNNVGVDPNSGLVELSETLADSDQKVATGCSSNQESSFVMTGRGGIPQKPNDRTHPRTWVDLRNVSSSGRFAVLSSSESLQEATSWYQNSQTGKIELVADRRIAALNQSETCATAF